MEVYMKNNRIIRCIAFTTSLFMLVPTFFSCGSAPEPEETALTAQPDEGEPTPAAPTLEDLYPLPADRYDGRSYDMLVVRTGYWGQDYNDLWYGEESGSAVEAASFERTSKTEALLDISLSQTESPDASAEAYRLYQAGDDTYELVQSRAVMMMPQLASNGVLRNIREMERIRLEAPWYNHTMCSSASIAGELYMIGGDGVITDKTGVAATMFNKKLASDFSLPDLYETVRNGGWTLDRMAEYGRTATADLNGDGELRKKDDRFGLIAEDFYGWFYMVSSGFAIAEKDSGDLPYFTAGTEEAVNAMLKIQTLMYDAELRAGADFSAEDYESVFSENRALFHANVFSTIAQFREMEADFGIIPLPKSDEAQSDYITTLSPYVGRFVGFPILCTDSDFVGTVFDVLSRYGTDTILNAYYDILLSGKIARDVESTEMLSLIFSSVMLDIGATYNCGNCWFTYQQYIAGKMESWVSTWASIEKAAGKAMEKTVEQYTAQP